MINHYKELVGFLGNVLPEFYEIILFDTTKKGYPVIEQSNWISQFEKETRKMVADVLKNSEYVEQGYAVNQVVVAKDKLCKISVLLLKDKDLVVGALCINMDCESLMKAEALISGMLNFCATKTDEDETTGEYVQETKATGLNDIKRMVDAFSVEPERMTVNERKEIFLDLYDAGVFRFKGAVPKAAEVLKMSEQSVYRYLSNIKKKRY